MKEFLHPESARDEGPDAATELLQLPGLGPKRVQVLRGVGVQSLDELRAAAQEQRLRCVPGFSAALEQSILRAVAAHVEPDPRRPRASTRQGVRASRPSRDSGAARRCDGQGHACEHASPTGWMRSIWRSTAG